MKKTIIKYSILSFFTAFIASTLISCSGKKNADTFGIAAAIDSIASLEFSEDAPGAVILIAKGDSVIYSKSIGLARLDSVFSLSENTLMNVASSTKTFTAAAILKLAEQGKLSLSDKITDYFPNLRDEVFGEVTLRHILGQTSGIPDGRPKNKQQWEAYLAENGSVFGYGPDFRIYGKERDFTRFIENLDSLDFQPGTGFERQDPPFMLLLNVIEKASGEPFEKWMKENIFDPAGIESARYVSADKLSKDMAHAYRKAEGEPKPKVFRSENGRWDEFDYGEADFFLSKADRGLYITPRDFVKGLNALNTGKIISRKSLDMFHIPLVSTGAPGEGYSLGVNIKKYPDGRECLYHRSVRGGFVAVESFFPNDDIIFLIFSNRNDWDYNSFASNIEQILSDKNLI